MVESSVMTEPGFAFSQRTQRTGDSPISELMQVALERPELISLAAGFVDFDTLPAGEVRAICDRVFGDPTRARAALQYGTTRGLPELRQALYDHLAALDGVVPADAPGSADDLVITTGSQQALHLLADLLLDPGDVVLAGWPSYFVFTGALETFGARVEGIDLDERGMIPAQVDAALARLRDAGELGRVKMVYAVPYHQNPTGISLAVERRAELLAVVQKYSTEHRILLLEDAAYRELGYDAADPAGGRSIKSLDVECRSVAYLGTFSKPFSPGFKTGYAWLPRDLVEPVVANKGGRDFGSPNVLQALLAEAMASGAYASHVERLREAYGVKLRATLDALAEAFDGVGGVTWTRPTGGLYVWLTLPNAVDTGKGGGLFEAAVDEGMLFVPGGYCYPHDPARTAPRHSIRLSFGVASVADIREGVQRLARAVRRATRSG